MNSDRLVWRIGRRWPCEQSVRSTQSFTLGLLACQLVIVDQREAWSNTLYQRCNCCRCWFEVRSVMATHLTWRVSYWISLTDWAHSANYRSFSQSPLVLLLFSRWNASQTDSDRVSLCRRASTQHRCP